MQAASIKPRTQTTAPARTSGAAKRVLFLHAGGDWIRGSENALLSVMRTCDPAQIEPVLFCSHQVLADRAKGVDSYVAPIPQLMIEDGSYQLNVVRWSKTVLKLRSIIKSRGIDVVYCNGGSTAQVGYYAGKLAGVPVICHVHSPYNRRHVLLYRLPAVSKLIFVSKAIERAITAKQKCHASREVIYNGVDLQRFSPAAVRDARWRKQLRVPADAFVFGQVSSLIDRKGIDVLIKAFAEVHRAHSHARLVLVGDGEGKSRYCSLCDALGIRDAVVFAGDVPEPAPVYQHVFDVNMLASRSDAFPLSLLEAAACGLPSIASAVDGIPESVAENVTGLLFASEDVAGLAKKMSELLVDSQKRQSLGAGARRAAVQRFSEQQFCESIQRIIVDQANADSCDHRRAQSLHSAVQS